MLAMKATYVHELNTKAHFLPRVPITLGASGVPQIIARYITPTAVVPSPLFTEDSKFCIELYERKMRKAETQMVQRPRRPLRSDPSPIFYQTYFDFGRRPVVGG